MEGHGRLQTEAWRVGRPVVADSCHFDGEQETDQELRQSGKSDPDPHQSEKKYPDPYKGDADRTATLLPPF